MKVSARLRAVIMKLCSAMGNASRAICGRNEKRDLSMFMPPLRLSLSRHRYKRDRVATGRDEEYPTLSGGDATGAGATVPCG
jgi:hypothetical protein